ncbi:D-tyrosyl-tRNA(Tyr) deacylase [candidate division WOR-3 bacterium]|uniref:D-aminoacyl-tRNA deacylase n=1 Tax=candidate division WOR-3 bacterium TaxID=2052148 RepID=A0A9D5QDB2_UNCW3|nr:D-tyrosyl-tRNA(Tyr) deacylase [candidate division WOR-3 bacterium]MBD3364932.1 D-tyrosyl-tRNA(Tyr) deacylase [candidate division WOR-3 bacterium]
MKVVVQRVSRACVRVDGEERAEIDKGLLVLLGIQKQDSEADVIRFAEKLPKRRFFEDAEGRMNLSLEQVKGSVLVVSQFTLVADLNKGLRPSFIDAMEPSGAEKMVDLFSNALRSRGINVREGVFGARMEVELINDGPVTFIFQGA